MKLKNSETNEFHRKCGAREYLNHLLNEGKQEPVGYENEDDDMQLPSWFDEELFKRAQFYYNKYLMGLMSGMLCGLVSVLAIPSILEVLIGTKQSSTTRTAYRRYLRTIFHVMAWHENDLKPGSISWKSLEIVRRIHFKSNRICEKSNYGRITQKDLALTQFGFMGFTTLKANYLGIDTLNNDYYESIVHFWRVIGNLIGIKDEYNLCTNSWQTTKSRVELMANEVYRPCLENVGDDFNSMATTLIHGLWYLNPLLSVKPFIFYTKRVIGCEGYEYYDSELNEKSQKNHKNQNALKYKTLSLYNRFELWTIIIINEYLYKMKIFRIYFNFRAFMNTRLGYYFPVFAIWRFGISWAYIRIFNNNNKNNNKKRHKMN